MAQGSLVLDKNDITEGYYDKLDAWQNTLVPTSDVKEGEAERILVINPMPKDAQGNVERNILNALGHNESGIAVQPDILRAQVERFDDHVVINFPPEQLAQIKQDLKDGKITGVICLGASADHVSYDQVEGFEEIQELFELASRHTGGGFTICWGSMAGLKIFHGIDKYVNDEVVIGYPTNKVDEGVKDPVAEAMKRTDIVPVGCVGRINDEAIEVVEARGELQVLAHTTDIQTLPASSISLIRSDFNSKGEKIAPFYHTGVHMDYGVRAIPAEIEDKLANPQGGIPLNEGSVINDPRVYEHAQKGVPDWSGATFGMVDAFLRVSVAYKEQVVDRCDEMALVVQESQPLPAAFG